MANSQMVVNELLSVFDMGRYRFDGNNLQATNSRIIENIMCSGILLFHSNCCFLHCYNKDGSFIL